MIATKRQEQDGIVRQAEDDLERYRELKGLEASSGGTGTSNNSTQQ